MDKIMKQNELISVIIPTYKRPDKLERAINSVIEQTYDKIEIIVVDDNNDGDDYRKKTKRFMNKYKNNKMVKYLKHEKNKGGALARNTGVNNSNGDFISFLDDDDEYLSDKIEKQYKKFNNSELNNLGMVYCQINFMDSVGNFRKMRAKMYAKGNRDALKKHMIRNLSPTSGLFIKKNVLEDIGLFRNLNTGHEYELILRLLVNGYEVDYNKEPLVNMYYHKEGRISNSSKKIKGEQVLFNIKQNYFNLIDEKTAKKVRYNYYIDMVKRHLLKDKKRISKKYLEKAFYLDSFKIKTIINYIGILINKLKSGKK